jgi:RNA polymerase sigma factor (sigma-70 family)
VVDDLFAIAYPLARRAAEVRSARAAWTLRNAGLDRQDLEQEALLAVYLALNSFDPLRAALSTFVERVVAAKTVSVIRRATAQKRNRRESLAPALSAAPQVIVVLELRIDLEQAFRRLNHRDRAVALLLGDQNPTEIARRLRISRAAVYRTIRRLRQKLRKVGLGNS